VDGHGLGLRPPYSVGWYAKDPEGKTYRFRELYGCAKDEKTGKWLPNVGTKETPDVVAKRIKAREEHDERLGIEMSLRLTGPDLFAKGGGQYGVQNTHAQTFRRHGLAFRPWWAGPGSARPARCWCAGAGAGRVRRLQHLRALHAHGADAGAGPDDPDDVDTEARTTPSTSSEGGA
jgi:hypothetical protein